MLKHLDLFSGIGGFALAAKWTGYIDTVAFCEIDPYCQKVLAKNFPGVPIYGDIRDLTIDTLRARGVGQIDLITGGFPCQDISQAGTTLNQEGVDGKRSGLYREYIRLINDLQPRYVVMENVTALLYRGLGRVLGDLAGIRYDAEWQCIPAAFIGAPHIRNRIFIVAYPTGKPGLNWSGTRHNYAADEWDKDSKKWGTYRIKPELGYTPLSRLGDEWQEGNRQPGVLRVVDGIPCQMDRLRALGNAIVPQVVYPILVAIVESEKTC